MRLSLFICVSLSVFSAVAFCAPNSLLLLPSDNPATSQWLSWQTPTAKKGQEVQWMALNEKPQLPTIHNSSAQKEAYLSEPASSIWRARLDNLQPETRYQYRVGTANQWTEWHSFTTAAAEFKPFTAIYFGDAQNAVAESVTPLFNKAFLQSADAQLVVHAGDLIDRNTPKVQAWQEWFYALGTTGARLNQFITPGNHEYQVNEQQKSAVLKPEFNALFAVKRASSAPFSDTVFSVIYQGVQFISLDTTALLYDELYASAQAQWLDKELAAGKATWRVVVMHHPVYTFAANRKQIRDPRIADRFQAIFERHQVDLVLQGHDHLYSRVQKNNVTYLISIAGPKMNKISAEAEKMAAVSLADTQLFQRIHFGEENISVEVFDLAGHKHDSFQIAK
jgi:phosphodiesterase/alkaline phosphatase D-like protein